MNSPLQEHSLTIWSDSSGKFHIAPAGEEAAVKFWVTHRFNLADAILATFAPPNEF